MDVALVLCEGLHSATAMLLFGLHAALGALTPKPLRDAVAIRLRVFEVASFAVLAATLVTWLPLVGDAMTVGGMADVATLRSLLTETGFGHVWLVRAALVASLGVALVARFSSLRKALLSGFVLGSLGFVGHAVMPGGVAGRLHEANQALHLLAAGAWLGGLVPLRLIMGELAAPGRRRDAIYALTRFSVAGHGFVALVLATGIVNTVPIEGSWRPNTHSLYGRVLLAKLLIVSLMVGVALFNRYSVVPHLRRQPAAALARLRRLSLGNLLLGAFAVALASLLGTLDPA